MQLLHGLITTLERTAPRPLPALGPAGRWRWLPFFEAYFSNFIEGTEFGVDEARRIAVEGIIPAARPADANDISATYQLTSQPPYQARTPASAGELLDTLHDWHALLMAARPDKRPGLFRNEPNYAGGYQFVHPDLLEGTLRRGFDALDPLTDPFHRAVAMMFLLTECHPFDDGNGRISGSCPTPNSAPPVRSGSSSPPCTATTTWPPSHGLSNQAGTGESLIAVLQFAQRWTAAINWPTFETANDDLTASNAYLDSGIADNTGQRLQLPG